MIHLLVMMFARSGVTLAASARARMAIDAFSHAFTSRATLWLMMFMLIRNCAAVPSCLHCNGNVPGCGGTDTCPLVSGPKDNATALAATVTTLVVSATPYETPAQRDTVVVRAQARARDRGDGGRVEVELPDDLVVGVSDVYGERYVLGAGWQTEHMPIGKTSHI